MAKINIWRVVLGGLVAGVICDVFEAFLNGGLLADAWKGVMASVNRPPLELSQVLIYDAVGLVIGTASVWTYAAIRPRFGAGPKTAVYAALLTWITAYATANAGPAIMGVYPPSIALEITTVGLIEIVFATLAGAFLYKEA